MKKENEANTMQEPSFFELLHHEHLHNKPLNLDNICKLAQILCSLLPILPILYHSSSPFSASFLVHKTIIFNSSRFKNTNIWIYDLLIKSMNYIQIEKCIYAANFTWSFCNSVSQSFFSTNDLIVASGKEIL